MAYLAIPGPQDLHDAAVSADRASICCAIPLSASALIGALRLCGGRGRPGAGAPGR